MVKKYKARAGGWTGVFANQNDDTMDRMRDIFDRTFQTIFKDNVHKDSYEDLYFSDQYNFVSNNPYALQTLYENTKLEILDIVEHFKTKTKSINQIWNRWSLAQSILGIAISIGMYFVDYREGTLKPHYTLPTHYPKWLRKIALTSIQELYQLLQEDPHIFKDKGIYETQMEVLPIEYEFFN